MVPRPVSSRRPSRRLPRRLVRAMAAPVVLVLVGCSALAPASSFDAAAPCGGAEEQRGVGLRPDLERLLPATVDGGAPRQVESGSYCSARALGLLAGSGYEQVDFAGATWTVDEANGLAIVVYRAPGLTVDALADAFARGADDARSVNQVKATEIEVGGRPGVRIDAYMRGTPQSVVVWPADEPDTVLAVIGSGVADAKVEAALSAAAGP